MENFLKITLSKILRSWLNMQNESTKLIYRLISLIRPRIFKPPFSLSYYDSTI